MCGVGGPISDASGGERTHCSSYSYSYCCRCLALLFAAAFAAPTFAAREEPVIDAKQAAEMAANEAASPFIALIKMLMGGDTGAAANDDAKTVAELAQNAPGNMSLLIDGVERAGLHTAIADPNFEATIFAPTNWVGYFCNLPYLLTLAVGAKHCP